MQIIDNDDNQIVHDIVYNTADSLERIWFVDEQYPLELERIHFVDALIDTWRILNDDYDAGPIRVPLPLRNDDYVFCIGADIGGRCNLVVLSSGDAIRRCNQGVAIGRCV